MLGRTRLALGRVTASLRVENLCGGVGTPECAWIVEGPFFPSLFFTFFYLRNPECAGIVEGASSVVRTMCLNDSNRRAAMEMVHKPKPETLN